MTLSATEAKWKRINDEVIGVDAACNGGSGAEAILDLISKIEPASQALFRLMYIDKVGAAVVVCDGKPKTLALARLLTKEPLQVGGIYVVDDAMPAAAIVNELLDSAGHWCPEPYSGVLYAIDGQLRLFPQYESR